MRKDSIVLFSVIAVIICFLVIFRPRYQEVVLLEAEYPALFEKIVSGEGAKKFWERPVPGVRYSYCLYFINGREITFKSQQKRDEAGNCIPGSGHSLVRVQVKRVKKIDSPVPSYSDGVQLASSARQIERQPFDLKELADYFQVKE